MAERITIDIADSGSVSALLDEPMTMTHGYIFAHGAGAGMNHLFMEQLTRRLVDHGIAVLRYQFPFMERGSGRPDPPAVAHATVRAAVQTAVTHWAQLPLFAGGKSFGGRMTSQAQAAGSMDRILGLAFVGFPLHTAGLPSIKRADHLTDVAIPMLFLQGSRDSLAELDLISQVVRELPTAEIELVDDADHAFHVRRQSGSNDQAVLDRLAEVMAGWMKRVADLNPHPR